MSFYVIAGASSSGNSDTRANTDEHVIIYADGVLPVFTSLETYSKFARAQHPNLSPIRPTPVVIDPLELAVMVEWLEATAGLKFLLLDPVITPSGRWSCPKGPMSVGSYCRYIVELARGTKRLFAEGRAKLGDDYSSPEERDELLSVWVALQAERVDDARARTEEWETEDGFWRGEWDVPT